MSVLIWLFVDPTATANPFDFPAEFSNIMLLQPVKLPVKPVETTQAVLCTIISETGAD